MKKLLKELHELLINHDASIVRAGDDSSKLVLCINNEVTCQEEAFVDNLDATSISNGAHESV